MIWSQSKVVSENKCVHTMKQFMGTFPRDSFRPEHTFILSGDLNATKCVMILFKIKIIKTNEVKDSSCDV